MIKKTLIKSYAKINLSLNILGKYKNNFHKIQSIISFLELHDDIYLKPINKKKHIVKFNGEFSKNIKKNTVLKLLDILDNKNLLNKKNKINIKKYSSKVRFRWRFFKCCIYIELFFKKRK